MADDLALYEIPTEIVTPADVDLMYVSNFIGAGVYGDRWISFDNLTAAVLNDLSEVTDWLDNVTLGANGMTEIPELVLTPRAAALEDVQGGLYYSSINDSIYVCTSDT